MEFNNLYLFGAIFLLIFGIINSFFGYKLFKVLLAILGFGFGAVITYKIVYSVSNIPSLSIVAGIIIGIVTAVLLVVFYFGGVFLIGASFGILIGLALQLQLDQITKIAIIAILAISLGVLSLIFQKFMVIVSSSFGGGFLTINSIIYLYFLLNGKIFTLQEYSSFVRNSNLLYFSIIIASLVIGVIGIMSQYKVKGKN
ncbi:MAG: hypothetical protein A2086_04175 [Spirochaetes bacterium GWD1_27_9]|nr:MAG: hypothetical protein A2Z98_06510 [Spirochaetes bacterium GWB1_27_13]OHD27547.1 MAG: hypothetical protein A2Y34_13830 [Spirochaetes bacterium GWC1_27_15]OHD44741.1 MAG: hypothetical protein A2086_04175 [Spirochaetes bacterium GWD1_27_9]